jgi:putative ABC transport system permease protein
MGLFSRFASGFRALVRKRHDELELDDELREYLNIATEQKIASGMTADAARRAARAEMGSVEAVKDSVRDVGWETRIETLLQDLRFALRSFLKTPRFTVPALLALALGIGATSAIFSVVHGVMLRPLPYREPERIVAVWETDRSGNRAVISTANFLVWRDRARSLDDLGMVEPRRVPMIIDGQADEVAGLAFSSHVFRALGVQPAMGRAYTAEEDLAGMDAVIVLSHEFWRARLGGRSDVLGMKLTMDGAPRTVIGVMPAGFTVAGQAASFLMPYGWRLEQVRSMRGRGVSHAIARLRDGVSLEQASTEMQTIAARLENEAPERNAGRSVTLVSLHEQMVEGVRPALVALGGAAALVLLVSCVNVANLLLARSATREREFGLRAALGARQGRLVRQMLTESLVLATAGGLAGMTVAAWFHRGLIALLADRMPIPRLDQVALDLPVLAFTLATTIATGVIFGLAPAFVSTSQANEAIREGGRHGGGRRRRRMLAALVVAEVALSLVLLAGAGLLMRSFLELQAVDPGFRPQGVLTAWMQLPRTRYDDPRADRFYEECLSRIAALPGVESAAAMSTLPLTDGGTYSGVERLDRPKPDGPGLGADVKPVTPGVFRTMGIPQVDGRDFDFRDTPDSAPVAIVSESIVRQRFAGDNPLGRRLRINVYHANGKMDMEWTIVGVVRDIKMSSLATDVRPAVYVPRSQLGVRTMTLVVRSRQDPASHANDVRAVVRSMDPEVPVARVRTLDDLVSSTIARPRAISVLVGIFAVGALLLAAVGVYGVMAYSVAQRTQEIGVRTALGATASEVFRLVLGQALRLVGAGVAIGLVAAGALAGFLERLLYETEPLDPWTLGATALVLLSVASLACYLPARRATRISPVQALRAE